MHRYNREAASRADRLSQLPATGVHKVLVDEIIYWDDLYRKELKVRQYLQENRSLPVEEPVQRYRQHYEIPKTGLELGLAARNLAKNVSVWKSRLANPKHPDAAAKYAMYLKLYEEAQADIRAERTKREIDQAC
ncbi:hypothetical protein GCM10028803_53430 [Larkinella knui]|uniref:Uncharacterized protein n=1 Tax=Larkinella knui TaxID=2025310 RepID=A0A3P1CGT3_9BACT|nr:hypothetical protein [Larkinella knui]RRB12450.1 hypothetical protein EHT87_19825 [Larkinella knui]